MTESHRYAFAAPVWLWKDESSWHFVAVPEDISDEIEFVTSGSTAGFGSVRVEVTIGATTWRTSLFPDTTRGVYVLPLKKQVRKSESIQVGDTPLVSLALIAA